MLGTQDPRGFYSVSTFGMICVIDDGSEKCLSVLVSGPGCVGCQQGPCHSTQGQQTFKSLSDPWHRPCQAPPWLKGLFFRAFTANLGRLPGSGDTHAQAVLLAKVIKK